MNEIEQAIKDLQLYINVKWGGRNAMFNLALTALREKAERENGCVWCKRDSKVTHNGEHFCFFCSYCGKRLEMPENCWKCKYCTIFNVCSILSKRSKSDTYAIVPGEGRHKDCPLKLVKEEK